MTLGVKSDAFQMYRPLLPQSPNIQSPGKKENNNNNNSNSKKAL